MLEKNSHHRGRFSGRLGSTRTIKDRVDRLEANANTVLSKLPQLILADFPQNGHYDRHLRKIRTAFKNQASCAILAIDRSFGEQFSKEGMRLEQLRDERDMPVGMSRGTIC